MAQNINIQGNQPKTHFPNTLLRQRSDICVQDMSIDRPWTFNYSNRNEAQERRSLLDTIFDYILYFGPPGKCL